MTPRIETMAFGWRDPRAQAFLAEHGYVVVRDLLLEADRRAVSRGWASVVGDAAARVGMETSAFVERFPQNRDLWRKGPEFAALLFETCQAEAARTFLGVSGVRLFHDHAICKPIHGSGVIPWHQDSAYWPLDRVGLSLWTAVDTVDVDGGCLEVLDGSHLDGAGTPQDFLGTPAPIAADDRRLVPLPVEAGDTVVLDGLTWHRSSPNRSQRERLAYLTLWVPATARFTPAHAAWHPTNAHIRVAPGERLDGDWFPLFGVVADADEGRAVSFAPPALADGPSMFTASSVIAEHLGKVLGRPGLNLSEILGAFPAETIALRIHEAGLVDNDEVPALRDLLLDLALQDRVRRESVARDVYLRTVERWWTLVGRRLAEVRHAG